MKKTMLKNMSLLLALVMVLSLVLTGCGSSKERILIYTSVEDYVVEDMNARLSETFPDYDITVRFSASTEGALEGIEKKLADNGLGCGDSTMKWRGFVIIAFFLRAGPPQRMKASGFSLSLSSAMIRSVKVSHPRP